MGKLYDSLLERKLKGEALDYNDLTDDDMYTLIVTEGCLNRQIAELYSIPTSFKNRSRFFSLVMMRRKKSGVSLYQAVNEKAINDPELLKRYHAAIKEYRQAMEAARELAEKRENS